ncbi:MAG: hypothetical protein SXG53_22845 [Pseudomonadota bacterium]|nr:hypothetical protein [Pseudomonadota bacterium]
MSAVANIGAEGPGLVDKVTSLSRIEVHTRDFSKKSVFAALNRQRRVRRMRRTVVASADSARTASERHGHRVAPIFITLTYRDDAQWDGKQISAFMQRVRFWLKRRGIALRYQWVIELTQRGRPHYHVLVWVPAKCRLPKPDQAGWWTFGISRIEAARRPVGYLVKYASKGSFDDGDFAIPRGARLFGCGNAAEERHAVKRSRLPVWVAKLTEESQLPRRVPHIGFVCDQTGEIFRTPFTMGMVRTSEGMVIYFAPREMSC